MPSGLLPTAGRALAGMQPATAMARTARIPAAAPLLEEEPRRRTAGKKKHFESRLTRAMRTLKLAVAEAHSAIDEEASRIRARRLKLCGNGRSGTNVSKEPERVKPQKPEKKPKKEDKPAGDDEERDAFSEEVS